MNKFMTVRQLAALYKGTFSESSIRYLIFNKKTNGLEIAIHKIGKKILINVEEFEKWIEAQ